MRKTHNLSPGLVIDFVQGIYDVAIKLQTSPAPIFNDRIAVQPRTTVVRNVQAAGIDSSETTTFTLTIINTGTVDLDIFEFKKKLGPVAGETKNFTVHACANVRVERKDNKVTIDQFTMPYGNFTRTEGVVLFTLTVTKSNFKKIKVLDAGIQIGTVPKKKTKNFNVAAGDTVTIIDAKTGATIQSFQMPSSNHSVTV